MGKRVILPTLIAILLCASCDWAGGLFRYGFEEPVAKVGRHTLYRSEIEPLIPVEASPEDSLRMAERYIRTWAMGLLLVEQAQLQLSKEDLNVEREVEEYRRNLLAFRYERAFLRENLDTLVTMEEAERYYRDHADEYRLEYPLVKARLISISKKSPYYDMVKSEYKATDPEYVKLLEEVCATTVDRYADFGKRWISVSQLALEMGLPVGVCISDIARESAYEKDVEGVHYMVCILDKCAAGEVAPLEYNFDAVSDIIVSKRKQELLSNLEQELFNGGLETGKLKIYDKEK